MWCLDLLKVGRAFARVHSANASWMCPQSIARCACACMCLQPLVTPPFPFHAMSSPPITLLHRHALESIFGWSSLSELAKLMRVCVSWQSAVLTMRSLDACLIYPAQGISSGPLRSRVSRHLATLIGDGFSGPANCSVRTDEMIALSHNASRLRRLDCTLGLGLRDNLRFPSKITRLHLCMAGQAEFSDLNIALAAVCALPQIEHFTLSLQRNLFAARFGVLATIPTLRTFCFKRDSSGLGRSEKLTAGQLSDLRRMSSLTSLSWPASRAADFWRVLQPGHALNLSTIKIGNSKFALDEESAQLLEHLPTLTEVEARLDCKHLRWIELMPQLSVLDLSFVNPSTPPSLEDLRPCLGLRRLALTGRASELPLVWINELLSRCPRLLHAWFGSLALSVLPTLPSSLTALSLRKCRIAAAELFPIFGLTRLQLLRLDLSVPLTRGECSWFEVPCKELPSLNKFSIAP